MNSTASAALPHWGGHRHTSTMNSYTITLINIQYKHTPIPRIYTKKQYNTHIATHKKILIIYNNYRNYCELV